MDGWETRRKRVPGHDFCLLALGLPGIVSGFSIDTAFFTGNQAPFISIQGTSLGPKGVIDLSVLIP
jgi:allantoicase